MSNDAYRQLLDATVRHLERLQEQGVRHVPVRAETLALLKPGVAATPVPPTGRAAARPAAATVPGASSGVRRMAVEPSAVPEGAAAAPSAKPLPVVARPVVPVHAVQDPVAKRAAMDSLRERALACLRCPNLAASRQNVVFGVGNIDADIVFVGEAPGADEDAKGEPFVGKAGELLTKMISAMGLSRDRIYIANVLKCRPDTPGQRTGNRKPTPEEMSTCLPYLREQIQVIRPKVLVALGATAIEGLLGRQQVFVTRIRGQWLQFEEYPVMPTYHPAYLLRNDSIAEKRKVWEDMLAVMELIGLPISEKQRGYFTKVG